MEPLTNVRFVSHPQDPDVVAVFPDMNWDMRGNLTCYAHIGQHGACSPDWIKETEEVNNSEAKELYNELTNKVGYRLNVLNKDWDG